MYVNHGRGDLQDFGVNTIEPDKLGITGYALHVLYDTLNGSQPLFLAQALHQVIKLGDDMLMKLLKRRFRVWRPVVRNRVAV